ncbi:uncharacterized protein LOC122696785 [Cervus elaphus]|uniref:uncharacterized protein LOC122429302 n=1 Tax=Cervus canadensis TaxID=1574408 RepID=UPI001CA32664|nr:uncharacterized protein LOC122429302 [Cervus canadensis]XP_043762855.1 uncharacterized protein LOC122696785 [Cervus elaphus]
MVSRGYRGSQTRVVRGNLHTCFQIICLQFFGYTPPSYPPPPSPGLPVQSGKVRTTGDKTPFRALTLSAHPVRRLAWGEDSRSELWAPKAAPRGFPPDTASPRPDTICFLPESSKASARARAPPPPTQRGPGRLVYSARSRLLLPLASRRVPLSGVCNRARGGCRGSTLHPLPCPVVQKGQTRRSLQFPATATTPVPQGGGQTGTRGQLAWELPSRLPDTGGPLGSPSRCVQGQRPRSQGWGRGLRHEAGKPSPVLLNPDPFTHPIRKVKDLSCG